MAILPVGSGSSSANMQVQQLVDFTGGLNLVDDRFKLEPNESPDLLNVDVDGLGGIRRRRAVQPFHPTNNPGEVVSMWLHNRNQIMAQIGSVIYYSTGGDFNVTPAMPAGAVTGNMYGASYEGNTWVVRNAEQVSIRWNGTAWTTLTDTHGAYNDDYLVPSGSKFPRARLVAMLHDRAWVAVTSEGGTTFGSRVRFSHPGDPGSWRSTDYIDVDTGVGGDEIVALMPAGDHLLVFKRYGVWAIYGYDENTFQVVNLTMGVGTLHQQSVVQGDDGIYFWSSSDGVYRYGPRQYSQGTGPFDYLFNSLRPAVDDGRINLSVQSQVRLAWVRQRLWVMVPWESSATANRVLVMDPNLRTRRRPGAWVMYDLPLGPSVRFEVSTGWVWIAAAIGKTRVVKLEQDASTDDFNGTPTHVSAHYVTSWFTGGLPTEAKRFRRPKFVVRGGATHNLLVESYLDYDPGTIRKAFLVSTAVDGSVLVWGPGVGSGNWDEAVWARGDDEFSEVHRAQSIGSGVALAFRVVGDAVNDSIWELSQITVKYKTKPIRG